MLLSTKQHVETNIGSAQFENSLTEKILGVTIEAELSFGKHIKQIDVKPRVKLKALARIALFMNIQKKKALMKAFLQLNLATAH